VKTTRVYRKGNRWYYVADLAQRNSRTGRRKQKWYALTRVDEGDAALLKKVAELIGETPKRHGNMVPLIAEFRAVHFKTLTFDVKKEYERMFGVIGKAFAEFDVHQVGPGDVIKFLNDNFAGKHTAKGHYKARLSTFFSWCVLNQERTGVRINPCREIKLKAPPKSRGKMNAAVYWRIYDALSPMGQCFIELMYLTRQRPTEIRLLRESQIGAERIHFRPTKTEESSGEEVDVLITPEIQAALDRARSLRPGARSRSSTDTGIRSSSKRATATNTPRTGSTRSGGTRASLRGHAGLPRGMSGRLRSTRWNASATTCGRFRRPRLTPRSPRPRATSTSTATA